VSVTVTSYYDDAEIDDDDDDEPVLSKLSMNDTAYARRTYARAGKSLGFFLQK